MPTGLSKKKKAKLIALRFIKRWLNLAHRIIKTDVITIMTTKKKKKKSKDNMKKIKKKRIKKNPKKEKRNNKKKNTF